MLRNLISDRANIRHLLNRKLIRLFPKQMSLLDISSLRHKYHEEHNVFLESSLVSKDPIKQFNDWFKLACETPDIAEPNAMTLATVKPNGRPAARMVLLKGYDEDGFRFYTNYQSAKSQDLEKTPYAALVFHWVKLCRSIRIEGKVERLPAGKSDQYFAERPRPSQIAAHVSQHQSSPIASRDLLRDRETELVKLYEGKSIPRPAFWGGFLVIPDSIEFWQGQHTRMHDRILFTKKENSVGEFMKEGDNGWVYQRLEP